jgi:protein-S-isoprenylcysteine O-methyltransferase Ste14
MPLYAYIMVACWIIFLLTWFFFSLSAKKTIRRDYRSIGSRIAIGIFAAFLIRASMRSGQTLQIAGTHHPLLGGIATALVVLGVGIAVWARVHIGRNWGMPMSVKESPELVTTGPYAYVRHPIYSGVMLAMLGAALYIGAWWAFLFLLFTGYFAYSAKKEEALLEKTFPVQYPPYKERTKMFVPFVL